MTCTSLRLALTGVLLAACGDDGGSNDHGNQNNGNEVSVCGNGVREVAEECDDGAANSDAVPDACRSDCLAAHCGDGVLDASEACDEGAGNSDLVAGACRRHCALASCGDGVVDPADGCDDGNTDPGDGCAPGCQVEPRWQCSGTPRSTCTCAPHRFGPGCGECRVFVDGRADPGLADGESWGTAYPTVQLGMEAAGSAGAPCEVWVADGHYVIFETSSDDTLHLRSGIALYGGFAGTETQRGERDLGGHRSVLDGSLGVLGVSTYHVVSALSVQGAVLDGFMVTRGVALGGGVSSLGGGLLALNSQVEVANCVFAINFAETAGGGVAAVESDLAFRDTVVSLNVAGLPDTWSEVGAGVAAFYSTARFERTVFAGNALIDGLGGHAIYLSASEALVQSSLLAGNGNTSGAATTAENVGGAAKLDGGSHLYARHDTVAYNLAWRGGGLALDGTSSVDATSIILHGNGDAFPAPDTDDLFARPGASSTATYSQMPLSLPCPGCFGTGPGFERPPATALALGNIAGLSYDPESGLLTVDLDSSGLSPHALAGDFAAIPSVVPLWIPIVDNTASAIYLWGDLTFVTSYGAIPEGVPVESYSLRLAPGSPCVDRAHGFDVPDTDCDGLPRQDDPGVSDAFPCGGQAGCIGYADVGAYERQP